jgi:sulfate adenylyltransferase subunit 1
MNTSTLAPLPHDVSNTPDTRAALRFVTCGSVDDGKSTLIGRLLVDSRAVLQDQLASVQRSGKADLALLTDGLQAEREQGITIDVAYRYFNTATRKFIIADAPGHEQYTRNMVTAASSADAAVVLVDATKLDWQNPLPALLPQTRRHSLLVNLLRVPAIVFAVNKLDAVSDPVRAFANITASLERFALEAGIAVEAIVPVSALVGTNVVDAQPGWCGYDGPSLLAILEQLSSAAPEASLGVSLPVQWVEKFSASNDTAKGRRIFWGRVATGQLRPGQAVVVMPGGKTATVAEVLDHARRPAEVAAGNSAGVVLDRELDVSRGDWLHEAPTLVTACTALPPEVALRLRPGEAGSAAPAGENGAFASRPLGVQAGSELRIARELSATVAWMDDEPLVPGRVYWALHGHRWIKAKVKRIVSQIDIHTLAPHAADQLPANAIGEVELALVEAIAALPYRQSRVLGSLVLVDTASHKTSGAALIL